MIILSHRGYWKEPAEKNTKAAFVRSFALGFGTETDFRDHNGALVISHDMPRGGEITAAAFFALYAQHGRGLPLALNIKADGLQADLQALLAKYDIPASDYFVFDMAVPDALGYLRREMPAFTRKSELEPRLHSPTKPPASGWTASSAIGSGPKSYTRFCNPSAARVWSRPNCTAGRINRSGIAWQTRPSPITPD